MALGTNFKAVQNIKAVIGTEAVIGDGNLHGSGTWYQLPLIAPPTITEGEVALDVGSQQVGNYVPNKHQMKQRLDNPLWEIQLQVLGTSGMHDYCQGLFGLFGGSGTLASNYSPPSWTNGATNTFAQYPTQVLYLSGANYDATNVDQKFAGCVCKSIELSHSVDGGGSPTLTLTFVTGYRGTGVNDVAGLTISDKSNDDTAHFTALTTQRVGDTSSANYDILGYSYNVSVSRDIHRVGYKDTTNYEPYSYEMVGGFDVSGSVTFKKDSNLANINNYFTNDTLGGFKFAGTGYNVELNGLVSSVANDTGSAELRNTITLQGAGDPDTSDTIVSIDL